MKIGFDAKRAVSNMTGLGNYSRLLIEQLALARPSDSLMLYAPKLRTNNRLATIDSLPNTHWRTPDSTLWRHLASLWRVSTISSQLQRDGIDLYHGLSNELPLSIARTGIPSVVTIHDLIFHHFPECYKPIDRAIYDYKFRRAAIAATRIIAISEATRRDLVDIYGIDPAKIDIVYQGCDPQFAAPQSPEQISTVVERYGIHRPYIIGVGTIETRKNQLLTLEALPALDPEVSLVLVGRRTPYTDRIERRAAELGVSHRLRLIHDAAFADLPALYAGAVFASYPSRFEGFGIPVIEALSAGTPVIVASGSCLEEAAGPDAPVVAPDSVDAFVDAARRIIAEPAYRSHLVDAGRRHISRFSNDAFIQGVIDTYNKALK